MRHQSSFCGPLIGLLFLISSTLAQNDCKFSIANSSEPLPQDILCNVVSENAVIGTPVLCPVIILVENIENLSVNEITGTTDFFRVEVSDTNKELQILVVKNLTEILQRSGQMMNHFVKLTITGTCKNGGMLKEFKVSFQINAENNHHPTFDKSGYEYEVIETMPANHLITTPPIVVKDRDYRNSDVSLVDVTITKGNEEGFFQIETVSNRSNVSTYEVKLFLKNLDLPYKKEGYNLTLTATDGGKPQKSNEAQVMITVIDVDNQDPIFNSSVYTSELFVTEKENKLLISDTPDDEGKEFNSKFLLNLLPAKLFAYDQDLGINANISYELVEEVAFSNYFIVGEDDPVLYLTKIDGQLLKKRSISLLVKAYQKDNVLRQAFALVNVEIATKPYEVQPIFTQEVELLRSQQEKIGFYRIQSSGKNPKYEIRGPDSENFELKRNTIQLKEKLTKEVQKLEIEIQVKTDASLIETSNTMKVIFDVVEVKKLQDPLFNRTIYRVNVWSDTVEKEVVFTIKALEEHVTYELTDGDTNVFSISRTTGEITLESKLQKDAYSLKVTGTLDDGKKTDTTEVIFNVVAKQLPLPSLFTQQIYRVDIFSDAGDKSTVFEINTTSSDVDVKIKKTEPQDGIFKLNSKEIVLSGTLDPAIKNYTIHVVGRIDKREEGTVIIVHVVPKNKTKSLFTREIYVIDIASDKLDQSKIFKPETWDPNVTISIEKTEPADAISIFEVDPNNNIILNKKLDPTKEEYTLHLLGEIAEQGITDTSKVYLHVIELIRPTASLFTKSQYIVNVPECKELGDEIFFIETNNKEGMKMEIIGDNKNLFQVSDAGNIQLLKKLEKTEYELEIKGTLSSTNDTDKTKVIFSVIKCALGKEYFEKCIYRGTIQENTAIGYVLAKFHEETENGKYTIKSGDDEGAFDVQKSELILKTAARDLKKESYYIVISATANDEKVLNFTAPDVTTEEAVVMLLFERRPQFLHPSPLVKVFTPSAPLSDYVFQIKVKQTSRQATFSLSGDSNNFTINSGTGLISPLTDVTKIPVEGFHTILKVTAQYNKDLKDTMDIHIIRLKWTQTLMMTSSSSPEHTIVENIKQKLSDISKCEIIFLQYQAVDKEQKTKLVKRSANAYFSEIADSKMVLLVAALKENKPLSLQEFKDLKFDKEKLTEIGVLEIDQSKEPEKGTIEGTEIEKHASNTGLVAAVATLGTILSLMVFVFVGVFVFKRYRPLLKRLSKESEVNQESDLKRWKPPTPPQRRTGKVNSETSMGVVNGGLTNDANHLYVDIIPDTNVYSDILPSEIKSNEIPAQGKPVETQLMEVAIAGETTDDITDESAVVQSGDDNVRTDGMQEREARKSVVTFCEEAAIIP